MAQKRKKKKKTREKQWEDQHETAFTHDLKRHRRTDTAVSDAAPAPDIPEDFEPNGLVISHSKKWAFVQPQDRLVLGGHEATDDSADPSGTLCRISSNLIEERATILAPGDRVLVTTRDDEPWVIAVAPRTSRLSRPGGEHARVAEQILAANIDVLVVVASVAKPEFKAGLVDRYLIAAQTGGVEPILCVNKMDLVETEPPEVDAYRELGIRVICASAETGEGLPELREALRGKLSVFAGHSGVGKSSLLNALQPDLDLATREVSEATQKGKHTTSAAKLYVLDDGIRIIDTPGVRALGLWKVSPEEVAHYFPEIDEAAGGCKFRDCTHVHEPGCAVLEAVEAEELPRQRYESYLRIRRGLEEEGDRR